MAELSSSGARNGFQDAELTQEQLAQLLWAAAGVTTEDGRRTAPSAGALYPLDLYVVVTQVTGLEPGLYLYQPEQHALAKVLAGDFRTALAEGSLDQPAIQRAPATLLYTVVYERLIERYGDRGIERYAISKSVIPPKTSFAGPSVRLRRCADRRLHGL